MKRVFDQIVIKSLLVLGRKSQIQGMIDGHPSVVTLILCLQVAWIRVDSETILSVNTKIITMNREFRYRLLFLRHVQLYKITYIVYGTLDGKSPEKSTPTNLFHI